MQFVCVCVCLCISYDSKLVILKIFEMISMTLDFLHNKLDLDKFLINEKYYCHKLHNRIYILYFGVTLRSMIG